MKSFFDSTLITNENHDFPLKAELQTIVANIQLMEQEYDSADPLYKPFLSATGLYALQKSLENKEIAETNTPQTLLVYLQELIHLYQRIKHCLSEIHQPLIEKLIESKFQLLHTVIIKLQNSEMPLAESLSYLSNANQIFDDMLLEHNVPSTANEIKEAMTSLSKALKKQELQQKINDQMLIFSQMNFDLYSSLDEFIPAITPLREALNALSQQAEQDGHNDLIDAVSSILNKSYTIEAQFIKRRQDDHLQKIEQNQWATIEIKRGMYKELIPIYNATLRVFSQITCSMLEKRAYINYLRTGFELCVDRDFLGLMNQSARLFYADDAEQLTSILSYTEQSHNRFHLAHTIIQKKRNRDEGQTDTDTDTATPAELSEKRTKQRTSGVEEEASESNDSSLQDSFINIIDPLNPGKHPSRRFMATMLKSLGNCVWGISGIENKIKLTMNYDLLIQAQTLCPEGESTLAESIKNQLERLCKGNERLIRDYNKYSPQQIPLAPHTHLSLDDFKNILSDFVTQLATYIRPGALNHQLKKLLEDWERALLNECYINKTYINQMMEAIQEREHGRLMPPSSQASSSSSRREFKNATDALRHASSVEFDLYLDDLKSKMGNNEYYLGYLTCTNKHGSTPLHAALSSPMHAIDNIRTYLVEVKEMYGASQLTAFHHFLITQNRDGLTFLHYLALLGEMEGLKAYTGFLKNELSEVDYARALRIKTPSGNQPYCNPTNHNNREINEFLRQERDKHPITESSGSQYGRLFTVPQTAAAPYSAHSFYGAKI